MTENKVTTASTTAMIAYSEIVADASVIHMVLVEGPGQSINVKVLTLGALESECSNIEHVLTSEFSNNWTVIALEWKDNYLGYSMIVVGDDSDSDGIMFYIGFTADH